MTIADRLKRWRDLARLRARAKSDPTPGAWTELAERLIAFGEVDDALRAAEEGLRAFPDSERLAQVRLFARKGRMSGQIRQLKDDIVRRPSPAAYAQLAQIYRELGSHDEALEIAAQCAERFPLNEAPHLLQAEVRLERFLRDQVARDAITAEAALQRVVRLNGHNARAHLLLADLYHVAGALSACRTHLRLALSANPQARDVQEFLARIGADADAAGAPADEEDFRDAARRIEETGEFSNPPGSVPGARIEGPSGERRDRAQIDVDALRLRVVDLGAAEGVLNSAVLDRDGAVLADASASGGMPRRQFAELVGSVASTSDEASRRMDTGALVRAEIEGPAGNVTVARVRSYTIGVLYTAPLTPERVWARIEDLAARNVGAAREPAHA